MRGELHEYQTAIDFLRKADAELKIVIAGNHDTSLDRDYAGIWGPGDTTLERHSLYDDAVAMWTDEDAFNDNIRYLGEGTKTFQLKNGAEFTVSWELGTPPYSHSYLLSDSLICDFTMSMLLR